jgi:hypothetical protein
VPHNVVEPKTRSKKKLVMQLDRDVQVCGIYLFVFLNTPCFEILLLLLFWRGVMLYFFPLCSLIGAHFFLSIYFFFDDPSLLLQDYKKRNLLDFRVLIFGGWMACFA